MSGDYTRFTDKPQKRYSGVLMQQGRVQLDADWNEQTEIVKRRWQVQAIDTFGHNAVPKHTTGDAFKITPAGSDLTLGEGRIYVEGRLAEIMPGERFKGNPITYLNQPFYPVPPALPGSGNAIVYLDVWEREVTYIEDPELLEKALGGPDTATRTQTVWQVKVHATGGAETICGTDLNALFPFSGGRLSTQANSPPASDDPCIISPSGGYRGLENRLYRVEIHTRGNLTTARFKWSRENASVVSEVTQISTSGSQSTLMVTRIGRDKVLRFQQNDWVEVTDDRREFMGQSGIMARIAAPPDESNLTITLDRAITGFNAADASRHTRVRRWDQQARVDGNGLMTVANTFMSLEDGVEIRFNLDLVGTSQNFEVGDYWVFAARTADSSVETLVNAPPRGISHNFCQLAVLSGTATPQDCRPLWPPDTGQCDCCTITVGAHGTDVGDFPDLPSAMAALPTLDLDTEVVAEICLLPGDYRLTAPIVITRGNTKIKGCGHDTTFVTAPDTAFRIDARRVTLEGMNLISQTDTRATVELTAKGDSSELKSNSFFSNGNAVETLNDIDGFRFIDNMVSGRGFVAVGGQRILIAENQMGGTLKIKVGSDTVMIRNNVWLNLVPQPTSVIDGAAIVLGANQHTATPRTVSEIDIIDNRIEATTGSGIVSGRFETNEINESQALGLRIIGNRIVNCIRQPGTRAATDPPYGGIVLATAQHLLIRDNLIADNGVDANVSVCGIYVRRSRGMEISANHILNNGRQSSVGPIQGPQGGILALRAQVLAKSVEIPVPGAAPRRIASVDGFPAALIADNIVSTPRGLALNLKGIGPMLVHGNVFSTSDLAVFGNTARVADTVGVVLIINMGVSPFLFSNLAANGFTNFNAAREVGAETSDESEFAIRGKIHFVDNQVRLDLSRRDTEVLAAAVVLFSLDDVNASNNQTECLVADNFLVLDLFTIAATTRQIGNGLQESARRCFFSLLSIAFMMNTAADNQGTHCIRVFAPSSGEKVDRDNLVLLSGLPLCRKRR